MNRTPSAENARLRRRVRMALRTLSAPSRDVLLLRDIEGLSTREVTRKTGLSAAKVKVLLHRGRMQLQAALNSSKCHAREPRDPVNSRVGARVERHACPHHDRITTPP